MNEFHVNTIINNMLKVEKIEEAFNCFLANSNSERNAKLNRGKDELLNLFKNLNQQQLEAALKMYINNVTNLSSRQSVNILMLILEKTIVENIIPPKMVFDAIMSNDKFCYQNELLWITSLGIIRRRIDMVDYKAVREIMKYYREIFRTFPKSIPVHIQPQMNVLYDLIEFIVNRDSCLLPGYLLVNEIQKAYPDNSNYPHWKLVKLFTDYVESYRFCAQFVSVIGQWRLRPIVEHSSCPEPLMTAWRLDPITLRFVFKGILPYENNLIRPQYELLRYVLEQSYSRDTVCAMLGLQKQHKQRCVALEDQLVEIIINAMKKHENDQLGTDEGIRWPWLHLSSQLIYFVLFQFASFPNVVVALYYKLETLKYRKGRDHLMWVLLQFISGSIQRNPLSNFLPVVRLVRLLYDDNEPLPLPDLSSPRCTYELAATCIWIHLVKKSQSEQPSQHWPIPYQLEQHYDFLQRLIAPGNSALTMADFRIALLCNAFSTNQEYFSRPMAVLMEAILGKSTTSSPVSSSTIQSMAPLSMEFLDSLTVHSKMSLIHSIVTQVIKQAQSKCNVPLSPTILETYSRLLVYTEIESLGIKGFITQLLPTVFKSQAIAILHALFEMFSYRIHHNQPHYRAQLLSHLHSIASGPQTNHMQLHLCIESTALRLITGLGNDEVQPQLSRPLTETKLISTESEELNRVLVLTLARSIHITGTGGDGKWCQELLSTIMSNTPFNWAAHTMECFPKVIHDFYVKHSIPKENKQQLKKAVDEEFRNWASMDNENDVIAHFSVPGMQPLFLCIVWKMLLETDRISPIAYKILERIGARALSAHLRKFCDCLVYEFTNCPGGQHVNKCVDTINDMVWKYNILTLDRLILCLSLRAQEGSEAQVCFFIIQLILLKAAEFRGRLADFVKDNSPEHWKQSNWNEKHLAFHRKFPEKFAPEEQSAAVFQPLPVYFSNVCLRFIPVFDIALHRYLEIPQVTKSLEILLEHLGCLYKFHDRPVTYLYNTLHYYEEKLRVRPALKRRLVMSILGSLKDIRPANWAISEEYQICTSKQPLTDENTNTPSQFWSPDSNYYYSILNRFVVTLNSHFSDSENETNKSIGFPFFDWRFNEFPNAGSHALYVTCVELMGLAVLPSTVANNLFNIVLYGSASIARDQLHDFINVIGLIISALPESYWITLQDRIIETMKSPDLSEQWTYTYSPFQMFNYEFTSSHLLDSKFSCMLALTHSIWHHAGVAQINSITTFIKDRLAPLIKKEPQFLYVCHLVGPFLSRFSTHINELTVLIYELLAQVESGLLAQESLVFIDPICDLLYHIKYMFVGDSMKSDLETIVRKLRPKLQMRLRFIAHLSNKEIGSLLEMTKLQVKPMDVS